MILWHSCERTHWLLHFFPTPLTDSELSDGCDAMMRHPINPIPLIDTKSVHLVFQCGQLVAILSQFSLLIIIIF